MGVAQLHGAAAMLKGKLLNANNPTSLMAEADAGGGFSNGGYMRDDSLAKSWAIAMESGK